MRWKRLRPPSSIRKTTKSEPLRRSSASGVAVGAEGPDVQRGRLSGEDLADQLAGDGPEAKPHHGVAGGEGEVGVPPGTAHIGQAVRRAGAQAAPGRQAAEIVRPE